MHLDEKELTARLVLWRVPGIGPAHFNTLLERFGQAEAVLDAGPAALEPLGLPAKTLGALKAHDPDGAAADLRWLQAEGHHLLTPEAPAYPQRLRGIAQPPPILFVLGDPDTLSHPQLAMVGSRNPSPVGRDTAHDFAKHLAAAGLGITSGLAQGIDAASHEGALAAQGYTLAVTATGLDRVYPSENKALAHRIAESGALISEFPIGSGPRPGHFPRRNRLISALSLGTLVVEAAPHSGSLITARSANEQGREVFAIPGSIHNPMARGCHRLIREGAKLVETAEDILEELAPLLSAAHSDNTPISGAEAPAPELSPEYQYILDCMGYDPTPIDQLVERSGLTPEAVSSMLLILELQDKVASANGGCYIRLKPRE